MRQAREAGPRPPVAPLPARDGSGEKEVPGRPPTGHWRGHLPRKGVGAEKGQTLVVFTVVCAFLLVATVALVGNAQVLFVDSNRADADALLAAQAGASAIDPDALYRNQVRLLPDEAARRCRAAASQLPLVTGVACTVSGGTVTAVVVERVPLPVPLPAVTETLRASRTARAAFGGYTGGF